MDAQIMEHNRKPAAMWGSGGRAYDEISRSIIGAIEHCVTRLCPVRGERVADIATGTGWTSRAVAQFGAEIVGIDIAEGLLAAARDISREQGLSIDYRLGDAEALPFSDGAFDAVISTFGVMFAPNQRRAAAKLARVTRPGGRVAIAAWTPGSNAVQLRQVLQPFITPAPTLPPSPPPSPFVWVTHEWLRDAFGGNFRVASEEGTVMSRFRSAEAAWEAYAAGFGPVRAVAGGLQGEALAEMRQAFVDWAAQFNTGLGIAIPFDYLVTIANRG
jgi:SAM-dependent methyltransferase